MVGLIVIAINTVFNGQNMLTTGKLPVLAGIRIKEEKCAKPMTHIRVHCSHTLQKTVELPRNIQFVVCVCVFCETLATHQITYKQNRCVFALNRMLSYYTKSL